MAEGQHIHNRQVHNGMGAGELPGAVWRKSRLSSPDGNCVEMALLPDRQVAVRNSTDPTGPALVFTHGEIKALLGGVRSGDFDYLIE